MAGVKMTDNELLRKCLEAFRAMKTADDSRRFLATRKIAARWKAGSGQHQLRYHMLEELERHLGIGKNSA